MTEPKTIKPKQIPRVLTVARKTGDVPFFCGPPGCGKSQITAQWARGQANGEDFGFGFESLYLTDLDPTDLRGMPFPDRETQTVEWFSSGLLPLEGNDAFPEAGLLLLDDYPQALPAMQAAARQIILDRRIGGKALKPGWICCLCGNRDEDRAATHRMPSHVVSALNIFQIDPQDVDGWIAYAKSQQFAVEVIAFLKFRPKLLHAFDPKSKEKQYPCYRAWERVSRGLQAEIPQELELAHVEAALGLAAASEFVAFLRTWRTLPNISLILTDPEHAEVPGQGQESAIYATALALARRCDEINFKAILTYANRLPIEFADLLKNDCVEHYKELPVEPEFMEWNKAHLQRAWL